MAISIRGRQQREARRAEIRKMYDETLRQKEGTLVTKNGIVAQIALTMGLSTATVYKDLSATKPQGQTNQAKTKTKKETIKSN